MKLMGQWERVTSFVSTLCLVVNYFPDARRKKPS